MIGVSRCVKVQTPRKKKYEVKSRFTEDAEKTRKTWRDWRQNGPIRVNRDSVDLARAVCVPFWFLDAFSHLNKRVFPSVRRSVRPSVGHTRVEFLRNERNRTK